MSGATYWGERALSPRERIGGEEGKMPKRNERHRRQCLYIQSDMLDEIRVEADRQERSLSWIIQRAWTLARKRVSSMPGANDPISPVNDDGVEAKSKATKPSV